MSDPTSNPYAPPTSGEPASDFGLAWQIEGVDLRAKNGVTLPMVDLFTGTREENMNTITQTVKVMTADRVFKGTVVFGIFIALRSYFELERFGVFLPFLILMMLLHRLGLLRKNPNSEIRVFAYVEGVRLRQASMRRRIRVISLVLLGLLMFVPAFVELGPLGLFGDWLAWGFPGATLGLIAIAVWAVVDKPKPKPVADQAGWVRFRNIHPEALSYLREREAENLESIRITEPGRHRLVRTTYYYRYPLRMLLGKKIFNPLAVIQIALLKWFRSPLLVRKTYDFREADRVLVQEMCSAIRKAVDRWLAAQENWHFIEGQRLPSPAGDITVETAIIASPELDHVMFIHHVWPLIRPQAGTTSVKFLSCSINGTSIWTQDHPHLDLNLPNVEEHRTYGSPDRVFQAHLRNCEGHMIRGPGSVEEWLRRIEEEQEITDRILTERGYQDEARQSA